MATASRGILPEMKHGGLRSVQRVELRGASATAAALLFVAVAACDPRARSGGKSQLGGRLSGEFESCAATTQCRAGLRCVDNECRRGRHSVVGDYYAAIGRAAMSRHDVAGAIDAYNRAVNQYEADKVKPPPDLYCAQGHALVAARTDPKQAELAARELHRCILGVPAGSALYRGALDDLADLADLGLEPLTLARNKVADAYLTRPPKRPSLSNLAIKASGDAHTHSRTYKKFLTLLESSATKQKLAPCWTAHWKATQKTSMSVTLPFRYRSRIDDYGDFNGAELSIESSSSPQQGAEAAATKCVRGVLATVAQDYARHGGEGSWRAPITITLGGK